MKSTDFSPQFSEVWGENASSDTITFPIPSTTTTSGRASLDAGFTSVNMTVLAAGGIPPFGQDFNGILKMLSTSARNYESGNVPVWSSSFSTEIGGYPQYALVQYGGIYYTSSTDDNTTTPGTSGSQWVGLLAGYATEAWVESNTLPSQSVFGQVSQIYYTPTPNASSSTSHTITLTFSAPRDGLVYATGSFNVSNIQPSQCSGTLEIGGSSYQPTSGASVWSDTTLFPMSGSGVMRVKKGDSISIISTYGLPPSSSTFAAVGQTLTYSFVPSGF